MILSLQAQDIGINFETGKSWQAILNKAKAENKYVFVDCFTTWCGPCYVMSNNVFVLKEVGSLFNSKFINVKYQLDSTSKDIDEVKEMYKDAAFIKDQYKVNAFPTYLFFNSNGELVHREVGACSPEQFITRGSNALDTSKQYYTQIKKYEKGNRDPLFLKNLSLLAARSLDESATTKFAKDYISTNPYLLNLDNLKFLYQTTLNVRDTGFRIILNNLSKFETLGDKTELKNFITFIIKRSEFMENKDYMKWGSKNWHEYEKLLNKKYPHFADHVLFQIKIIVFQEKNEWLNYTNALEKYNTNNFLSSSELNEHAWIIFTNSNDKNNLQKALKWSKSTFRNQKKIEPGYIDTYANLLYKLGRKNEAIKWQKKAQKIAIEQGSDKNWGQEVIDKMTKGEKTW